MDHWALILLIVNVATGEVTDGGQVGKDYDTIEACANAALDTGPQPAKDGSVKVYGCVRKHEKATDL